MNEEKLIRRLGQRIKELRMAAGYDTPEAFAVAHNIPIADYLLYEQGIDMDMLTILSLTVMFGVAPVAFFKGLDD